MNIYIDCEFDAIRIGRKHQQCIVSIGAVANKEKGVDQQFYALIHPKNFKKLTRVVRSITQLQDEEILKARSFSVVMKGFHTWVRKRSRSEIFQLFSFGPDDKRTILTHARYEGYENTELFENIIDLQREISKAVLYHGQVVSPTLSLDDLKYVYELEGEVVHNALNDAADLMRIHQAYLQKQEPNPKRVQDIFERKEAKRQEVKAKQQARMVKLLNEKYEKYKAQTYVVNMVPQVVEQMQFLEEQEHLFKAKFYEDAWLVQGNRLPYAACSLEITWHMGELPYALFKMEASELSLTYTIVLNYRNAAGLEAICKSSGKEIIL